MSFHSLIPSYCFKTVIENSNNYIDIIRNSDDKLIYRCDVGYEDDEDGNDVTYNCVGRKIIPFVKNGTNNIICIDENISRQFSDFVIINLETGNIISFCPMMKGYPKITEINIDEVNSVITLKGYLMGMFRDFCISYDFNGIPLEKDHSLFMRDI